MYDGGCDVTNTLQEISPMNDMPLAVSLLLIVVVSGLLIVTGLKKQPGIGMLGALVIVVLTVWLRGKGLAALGFGPPASWGRAILLALGLGVGIQLLAVTVLEPLGERLTGSRADHSVLDGVRGNPRALVGLLVAVWLLVAPLEEGLYRGFLMTEMARVLGTGTVALAVNVLLTSVVFGLSHGYQGRSGILGTGVVGALLGILFVLSDFNLWTAILTHGVIDTIGIGLIAVDGDRFLRERLWGENH